MASAFNKFNTFMLHAGKGIHVLDVHVFKVLLSNVAPVATLVVKADITEIAAQNGYVAGGAVASVSSWAQVSGLSTLILADPPTWTGTGGSFGPHRYAVLYNSTVTSPVNQPLCGWWDYGSSISTNTGETYQVDLDQGLGVFTWQ